jgi:hypothetical protein
MKLILTFLLVGDELSDSVCIRMGTSELRGKTNELIPAFPLHTTQPLAICLNPDVFVQNLIDNYR